ncbi:hypothetical protein LTR97_011285 [Elasticomyces elasticus]|uniref:Heterokaryon incompatibility domain-containing protein n=1 Tax=Elasticomyces elasticus TaxID=574655 RepID=A0AAN7W856_9PEZI|nr:hypothetical protein LTR97_011285 [Elasticomyces elasticus]
MASSPYKDLPDGHIRILALLPGEPASPLMVELKSWPLRPPLDVQLVSTVPCTECRDRGVGWEAHLDTLLGNKDGCFDVEGRNFSHSARRIGFEGGYLVAELATRDGRRWVPDKIPLNKLHVNVCTAVVRSLGFDGEMKQCSVDLNSQVGNADGRFDVGKDQGHFGETAKNITLHGTKLAADLVRVDGSDYHDEVDLYLVLLEAWRDSHGYEALSYCWGDPVLSQQLSTSSPGGTIPITESLHVCLRRLRVRDSVRYVWADAVSINQQYMAERNTQVQMMADIYKCSRRTLVWLGDAESGGPETLAFAALQGTFHRLDNDNDEGFYPNHNTTYQEWVSHLDKFLTEHKHCECCGEMFLGPHPGGTEALRAFVALLERPWFRRLWVVQEVTFAPHVQVMCGTHQAEWMDWERMCECLSTVLRRSPCEVADLDSRITKQRLEKVVELTNLKNFLDKKPRRHDGTEYELDDYFFAHNGLGLLGDPLCTEPLDRVFAIGAVFGFDRHDSLHVDYRLPAGEVYRRLYVHLFTRESHIKGLYPDQYDSMVFAGGAFLLSLVGTETQIDEALLGPSWVPNLHRLSAATDVKGRAYRTARSHAPGVFLDDRGSFSTMFKPHAPDNLWVRGRCFATIDAVLEDSTCPLPTGDKNEPLDMFDSSEGRALLECVLSCDQWTILSNHFPTEDFSQWVKRNLTASTDTVPSVAVIRSSLNYWVGATANSGLYRSGDLDPERKVASTSGKFGSLAASVPRTAQRGDQLCYFTGAPYPFVVRDNGDGTYRLLGDAFTDGIEELDLLNVDRDLYEHIMAAMQACDIEARARHERECDTEFTDSVGVEKEFQRLLDQVTVLIKQAYVDVGYMCLR